MKFLWLPVMTCLLNGCFPTTVTVLDIGKRASYGEAEVSKPLELISVELTTIKVTRSQSWSIHGPYMQEEKIITGSPISFEVNLNKIVWDSLIRDIGTLTIDIDGKKELFNVLIRSLDGKPYIHLNREYRLWYGYPAQVGLIAAVPVDLVLNLVGGVTIIGAAAMHFITGFFASEE